MNWFILSLCLLLEGTFTTKQAFYEAMKGLVKLLPMIITATIAVGLKLIVESKRKKITFWNASISWFSAVGISYIFFPAITKYSSTELVPLWLAFVVLVGDKISTYFVEKFNVDVFLNAMVNYLADKLKNLTK